MKTLADWNAEIHRMERLFNKHYWLGHMVLAHEICLFYNKLLHAVKLSYPEYRHR
jgi:hypothetical protein